MTTPEQVRDQLLPGLWGWQKKVEQPVRRNIDLVSDPVDIGALAIVIDGQRRPFLSKAEIDDGSWREKAPWLIREKLGDGYA